MIGPQTMTDELGEWDGDQAYVLEGPGGQKTLVFGSVRFLLFTVRFYTDALREDHLEAFFGEVKRNRQ